MDPGNRLLSWGHDGHFIFCPSGRYARQNPAPARSKAFSTLSLSVRPTTTSKCAEIADALAHQCGLRSDCVHRYLSLELSRGETIGFSTALSDLTANHSTRSFPAHYGNVKSALHVRSQEFRKGSLVEERLARRTSASEAIASAAHGRDLARRVRALAKSRGRKLGRPSVAVDASRVASLRAQGRSWGAISAELEIGRGTAQRACAGLPKNLRRTTSATA